MDIQEINAQTYAQEEADKLVDEIWKLAQRNNEIISRFTAKQLATLTVDKVLANIDATIFYHKNSLALPHNKEHWLKVRSAIR